MSREHSRQQRENNAIGSDARYSPFDEPRFKPKPRTRAEVAAQKASFERRAAIARAVMARAARR